jgi:hypothetical protein
MEGRPRGREGGEEGRREGGEGGERREEPAVPGGKKEGRRRGRSLIIFSPGPQSRKFARTCFFGTPKKNYIF